MLKASLSEFGYTGRKNLLTLSLYNNNHNILPWISLDWVANHGILLLFMEISIRQKGKSYGKNFNAYTHNKPWMLYGDFNDTRFVWERSSTCSETSHRTCHFNTWVEDMHLLEVQFSDANHTWARGLSEDTCVNSRLDRTLCNWSLLFPKAEVKHLAAIASDHCPY